MRIGFGKRALAYLTDTAIILLIGIAGAVMLWILSDAELPLKTTDPHYLTISFESGLFLALFFTYTTSEIFYARTPGKMINKIVICNADGSPAEKRRLVLRWMIKNIALIMQCAAVVTCISMIETIGNWISYAVFFGLFLVLTQSKQTLHDIIAGTAVYPSENTEINISHTN